ncbi:MAG: hypothetical protein EPO24_05725 [Bacteroidetes bacterium]|nr:MAG: hypothetical protein EPO24_05725 [Bacteroidota bacterium]
MSHLTEFEIASLLDKQLHPTKLQEVERHLADCALCSAAVAESYHLIKLPSTIPPPSLSSAARRRAEQLVKREKSVFHVSGLFSSQYKLAFALLLVGIIAGVWYFIPRDSEPIIFRSPVSAQAPTLIMPLDGSVVNIHVTEFRWSHIPDAASYDFSMYNEHDSLIWRQSSDMPSLMIPDSVSLQMEKRYFWEVKAMLSDGTQLPSDQASFIYTE